MAVVLMHTVPTYCNWDRLIKIPLLTALEQTAKLGRTMNIFNTTDFPTWLASPYSANYRHGPFQGTAVNALIRVHYIKFFTHLARMIASWQFPELVHTAGGMHTNFQTITINQMPEKTELSHCTCGQAGGFAHVSVPPTEFRGVGTSDFSENVDERLSSKLRPPQQRDRPFRKVSLLNSQVPAYSCRREAKSPTIGQNR